MLTNQQVPRLLQASEVVGNHQTAAVKGLWE